MSPTFRLLEGNDLLYVRGEDHKFVAEFEVFVAVLLSVLGCDVFGAWLLALQGHHARIVPECEAITFVLNVRNHLHSDTV